MGYNDNQNAYNITYRGNGSQSNYRASVDKDTGSVDSAIQVTETWDKYATTVTLKFDGELFVGSARRSPGDDHEPWIGQNLAFVRAMRLMADCYEQTLINEAPPGTV